MSFILEQRIWVTAILANPFFKTRQQRVDAFAQTFSLSTRTYEKRLHEINKRGWKTPFRREQR